MNRGQIRAAVRSNLSDAGITFYEDSNINDAIQDGYNEVAAKCRCIQKSATILQAANSPYYDLTNSVSDFLGTIAIFNRSTNFWLRDDVSLRDFDRLRRDWEKWNGQPQFWAPHSLRFTAVAPNLFATNGETFTWWYWATAPTLAADSDSPLIATDMQTLLETYATADLLEDATELTKASVYRAMYEEDKVQYRERCVNLARAELLLRI